MPLHPESEKKKWGNGIDWFNLFQTLRAAMKVERIQAVVEHVHAMPKQGVSSTFKFGANYGGVLTILQALQIPYRLVRPVEWKRRLLGPELTVGKQGAVAFAMEHYPDLDLRRNERCRIPHDGKADALCLAHYGLAGL